MGNAPRQPNFDPHSKTYNPGWRHHPNFGWGGQGNQFQQGNQFNQGPRQYNNNFQQPNPSLVQPNTSKQPSRLELALQKLTLSTATFVDGTNDALASLRLELRTQQQLLPIHAVDSKSQLSEASSQPRLSISHPTPSVELLLKTANRAAHPCLGVQHPRPAWRLPLSSSKPRISTQQGHAQALDTPRLGVGSSRQKQRLLSHTPRRLSSMPRRGLCCKLQNL
ncbi:hypothetical protein PIB30_082855 [Stylosanthes scabra]|uniref:Uncharacterized protein n=1 Tax=Stylosanthes scabra TaxID=79078 RepID=A0ABU6TUX5_9FABA|nr:hypothetical protein [Stylosanthes scabra]